MPDVRFSTPADIATAAVSRPVSPFPPRITPKPVTTGAGAVTPGTFQTGHGWTAAGAGSSNMNDTTIYALGSQSASITTNTTAGTATLTHTGVSVDLTGKSLRILVRFDNLINISFLRVYAGDSGFANYYLWDHVQLNLTNTNASYFKEGEWAWLTLNVGDASVSGTPPRSALVNLRFSLGALNATACTLRVNAVATVPDAPAAFPNGVVSLCFDDGLASQYTIIKPMLDKYLFPATFYPIVDIVGSGGYMTLAQMQDMHRNSGHEFGVHSNKIADHNAGFLSVASASGTPAVVANVAANKQWLFDNGLGRGLDGFAWPLGFFSTALERELQKVFAYQRTITNTNTMVLESLPPTYPSRLRSLAPSSATTGSVLTGWVDQAYAQKGWLIVTMHDTVASGASGNTQMNSATVQTLVDYLWTKGIPVRTVSDVLRTLTQ